DQSGASSATQQQGTGSSPSAQQSDPNLPPVTVDKPVPRRSTAKKSREGSGSGAKRKGSAKLARPAAPAAVPLAPTGPASPPQVTPGAPGPNLNAVAPSASRLNLPILEMPASVSVIDQRTMQEQGYRTTTETAQGSPGVLAGDAAGAPANFS